MLFSASTNPRKRSLGGTKCNSGFSHTGIMPPQQTYHPSGPVFSPEISTFADPPKKKHKMPVHGPIVQPHFSFLEQD